MCSPQVVHPNSILLFLNTLYIWHYPVFLIFLKGEWWFFFFFSFFNKITRSWPRDLFYLLSVLCDGGEVVGVGEKDWIPFPTMIYFFYL